MLLAIPTPVLNLRFPQHMLQQQPRIRDRGSSYAISHDRITDLRFRYRLRCEEKRVAAGSLHEHFHDGAP